MEHGGIDVHKNESQICLQTEQGEILEQRIHTRRDRCAAVLGPRPRARLLIEASTESEWVARCLEELGHEVIVADPNFAPMYATRSRRVKTDRRDAQALLDACVRGSYRRAHRTSEAQRQVRALLTVRENLVRTRARQIQVLRALTRREGLRVRSGEAASFERRLGELDLPECLRAVMGPVLATLEPINQQVEAAERAIQQVVQGNALVRRLRTAPGVGPITAVAFVAALDGVERFAGPHQVECYLGLVPREKSSGERQHKGAITKAGNPRMRWLMVEAAWRVLISRDASGEELRRWAQRIAVRRGRRIAVVALARRLTGILYAMWRDGTDYDPRRSCGRATPGATMAVA
jgi:transposase